MRGPSQLAVTVCHMCYKRSKKALTHPQDHLEHSLRPIQATQVTPEQFWTRPKRLTAFRTSNKNLATWNLFFIEGAPQFPEPLKWLCAMSGRYNLQPMCGSSWLLRHLSAKLLPADSPPTLWPYSQFGFTKTVFQQQLEVDTNQRCLVYFYLTHFFCISSTSS